MSPEAHVVRRRAVLGGLHHEYWFGKEARVTFGSNVIVRNALGKIVRILGGKSVARYTRWPVYL